MFTLLASDPGSRARLGRLRLRGHAVDTPAFMPVGTQGTVKCCSPGELEALGAQIILGNTYHLAIRPGTDVLALFGGLHGFMAWDRPILTDSGGYQVFSLAKLRRLSEQGVTFQNHIDGTPCTLTPESVVELQHAFRSDIAMVLDECPPYPCDRPYAEASLDRTLRWAQRSRTHLDTLPPGGRPFLFGIAQGATFPDLRERAARELRNLDFAGYAIGGVSVGEPEAEMMAAVEACEPHLPGDKPRYAMGLGTPPQIVELVARGIDLFDCVLPTRLARNGTAFTASGTLNLRNGCYTRDTGPIEPGCDCPACATFSRAYVRHLLKAEEILGLRLVTLHNLHFYLGLMRRIRRALEAGDFPAFRADFNSRYGT